MDDEKKDLGLMHIKSDGFKRGVERWRDTY